MSGNQVGRRTADAGHRTAEKAKIICPPPSGVDIIKFYRRLNEHVLWRLLENQTLEGAKSELKRGQK